MSYSLESDNAFPSKIIYLDSRDATTYLATTNDGQDMFSYFQYQLTEQVEIPDEMNVLISLNGATIPYSFYNIREDVNDKVDFSIVESGTTNTGTGTLTIPAGNYSAISLGNFVEDEISDLVLSGTNYNFTFTMDYQSDKQKYQYGIAGAGADVLKVLDMTLLFGSGTNSSTHANVEFGFRQRDVILTPTTSLNDRTSDNVIDINGSIHGVYIRTNLVSSGTLDSQNGTFSNILARIPIKVQSGGIIFAESEHNNHKSLVDLNNIGVLTIRLTDERNRILDLNGLHFQLAIQIDFIKKPNADRLTAETRRLVGSEEYSVVSDTSAGSKIELARENIALKEEINRYQSKYRVGRPRKVGRPKKTKIDIP